jgi:hypothetical protein
MNLIQCSQRGVGEFPEFISKKLERIDYVFVPGKHPHQFHFIFGNLLHVHATANNALHPNNYKFLGKKVSAAKQFRSRNGLTFQFLFTDGSELNFEYREDLPTEQEIDEISNFHKLALEAIAPYKQGENR